MNKSFLLTLKNNLIQFHRVVFEKTQKPLHSDTFKFRKNDVIEPKARRLLD